MDRIKEEISAPRDYRTRIYSRYSRMVKAPNDDDREINRAWWQRVYSYYLRGWMPTDKQAMLLDLACGEGYLLAVFKNTGYQNLCGVDISPTQAARARELLPNIEIANALDYLQSKPEMFDLIVALDIIEHFRKDEALEFLDLCFAALRPAGRLILQTPNAESPFGAGIVFGDFTHETAYTPRGLQWVLEMCGFVKLESRPCDPVPSDWRRKLQRLLWRVLCFGLEAYSRIEGHRGSGIFTRVFLISGVKPS